MTFLLPFFRSTAPSSDEPRSARLGDDPLRRCTGKPARGALGAIDRHPVGKGRKWEGGCMEEG